MAFAGQESREKKLQVGLTESAQRQYASVSALLCCSVHHAVPQSQAAKRMALTWTEFLSTEFT